MDTLHEAERDFSAVRQSELSNMGVTGDFSLKHMCSIHKQLFQDVYSWAGKTRIVDISKGTIFCLVQFIESQFDDLYRKLKKENFLADISDEQEMSLAKKTVVDVEEWTARNTVRNMYPGHAMGRQMQDLNLMTRKRASRRKG